MKTTTGYRAAYPVVAICRAFTVVILAMICWLGLQSRSHAQLTATWNGTTGMWSDPSRWSTAEFPDNGNGGFNYNAVVGAGTVTLDQNITIEELTLSGGVLSGSSPLALTLNSGFLWTGGSLSGSFTIQANGGMSLDGGTKTFNAGHTLNNGGVANWTSGNINSGGGAAFNNQVGASFNTDFDGSFNFNQGGALPQFHNAGTFTKSGGAGSTVIGAAFNNSGMVNVNSGSLSLLGGGTSTGNFAVSSGNNLIFSGGTHTLNAGTSVSGAGAVLFSGGTSNLNGGTYNVTGTTTVSGGTTNFNVAASTNDLTVSGGTRGGTGTLTASGQFTWSGGTLTGVGTTQANGGMLFNGGTKAFNAGHTLNNGGVASWTSGNINSGGGAAFNNQIGASFDTDFDGSFNFNQGGILPQFHNAGTFTKSGGAGSTVIGAAFHNSGLVGINSGTVTFNSSYLQTAGALVLNGGNANSNSTLVIDGGEIQGDGILIANVNNTGGTMSPGFSAGQITVDGNLFSGANSSWLMQIGGLTPASEYDFLQVTGNLSLNGVLNLELINGFEANIQPGDLFTLATSANLSGAFSNIASGSSMTVGSTTFDIFYGSGSPYGSHSVVAFVSVPEPGSGGLVLLAIVLGMAGRRLRNDEGSK